MKKTWLTNVIWIAIFTLTPFLVSSGFWFVLDYADTSQGIERERETGINHTMTNEQMLLKAIQVAAKQSWQYAVIGFAAGSIGLLGYRRSQKRKSL
jgi:hypothetical protein